MYHRGCRRAVITTGCPHTDLCGEEATQQDHGPLVRRGFSRAVARGTVEPPPPMESMGSAEAVTSSPPVTVPTKVGGLRQGAGILGLDPELYIHLVWDTPSDSGSPILTYAVNAQSSITGRRLAGAAR